MYKRKEREFLGFILFTEGILVFKSLCFIIATNLQQRRNPETYFFDHSQLPILSHGAETVHILQNPNTLSAIV